MHNNLLVSRSSILFLLHWSFPVDTQQEARTLALTQPEDLDRWFSWAPSWNLK
jgi:hypothetical protein